MKSLILSVLCASAGASALTLADFSFADHESFVARFGRAEAHGCAGRLVEAQPVTAGELMRTEARLRRATGLIAAWRAAEVGEVFYAAFREEFESVYAELLAHQFEFALPVNYGGAVERVINQLRFIDTYQGFVATETELGDSLFRLLTQRIDLERRARPAEVARFTFELAVLRGQEFMIAFKRAIEPDAHDVHRAVRAKAIDQLAARAAAFVREVSK